MVRTGASRFVKKGKRVVDPPRCSFVNFQSKSFSNKNPQMVEMQETPSPIITSMNTR